MRPKRHLSKLSSEDVPSTRASRRPGPSGRAARLCKVEGSEAGARGCAWVLGCSQQSGPLSSEVVGTKIWI